MFKIKVNGMTDTFVRRCVDGFDISDYENSMLIESHEELELVLEELADENYSFISDTTVITTV